MLGNLALLVVLFVMSTFLGAVIMDALKKKVTCTQRGDTFAVFYRNRTIYIRADNKVRIPSYNYQGDIEFITLPVGHGYKSALQAEHFISRYKTTRLVKCLFNFSEMKEPLCLLHYDPAYAKELSQIQYKLLSFIRSK